MAVCLPGEAGMQVSPTQIVVAAEHRAAGLTLLNSGDESLYAQIRVFAWQQHDGKDQLLPSQDIVASPPMMKLTPGVHQLVRIVRQGLPPDDDETSYRIIIDEVPVSDNTDAPGTLAGSKVQANGLQFRLRYSIPVFLAPPKQVRVQPVLHTRLIEENGAQFIHIRNEGNAHAQIADLIWTQDERHLKIAPGLAGYILPGQQRQWPLPDTLNLTEGGVFTARINGEMRERILVPVSTTD